MKILTVFNNNVVLATDELGREVVLTGRGVGFKLRGGDEVNEALVVRRFVPTDNADAVGALLADIPPERLTMVIELFSDAVRELGSDVPPLAIIAAADHIHQAIERIIQGHEMEYPLRSEVAHLHPEELRVAEELVTRISSASGIEIPSGEATALAMHLFHTTTGSSSMAETYRQSRLIRQIFELLSEAYGDAFDADSVDAARFAAHLRYFFTRAKDGRQFSQEMGKIGSTLRDQYPTAYQLAERIRALLELRLNHPISEDEVIYLTIHVARLEEGMKRDR